MPIPVKTFADAFVAGTTDAVNEGDVHVSSMRNGRFVFNWTSGFGAADPNVRGHVYSSNFGNTGVAAVGGATTVAGSATVNEQEISSASFASGQLRVSVWSELDDAGGSTFDLYAAVHGNSVGSGFGETQNGRFAIATGGNNVQRPQVITLGDTRFAVAWINATAGTVEMAVYNTFGTNLTGGAVTVSTTAGVQSGYDLGVTELSNGSFVISWRAGVTESKFRIYTSSGSPVTAELNVDPATSEGSTSVVAMADGRFMIAYYDDLTAKAVIFEATGAPAVGPITITTTSVSDVQVAALHDGRVMAVWYNSSTGEILARIIRPDGAPDGAEFAVNTVTTGTQRDPTIAVLADGRVVVGWVTNEDGDSDLKFTVYDPREGTVYLTGTGVADELLGTAFGDQLAGGNGDDALSGGGSGDQLTGGAGEDALNGDDGNDFILGEGDADTMQGGAGQDTMYGGLGRDVMRGDADNDYMVGQAGGDDIRGGSGNEVIIGDEEGGAGDGFDYLEGGVGDDLIFGCGGNDQIIGDNAGGTGVGNDTLYGMDGNDTVFAGLGADLVYGGSGDDFLFGNEDGDYIVGEGGADTIEGGAGNDILLGDNEGGSGTGNDTINGGAGNDQIYLGAGGDAVRFDQAGAANADQVFNFTSGQDKVALSFGAFGPADQGGFVVRFVGGPGAVANTNQATILYDTNTGSLLYDADGNGAGAAVIIATFSSVPTLAAGDLVFY